MTPIDILAVATMAAGLFSAGYVVGRANRSPREAAQLPMPEAEPDPTARFVITILGHDVQTNIVMNMTHLQQFANGMGYYVAPLPSKAMQ